ncbi:MAG: DUF4190 domain-containing protein [Verrucomicrobia bacterium]|nr:DUF4190 domain-containing protein [Verrucomicrobiota bacterium]
MRDILRIGSIAAIVAGLLLAWVAHGRAKDSGKEGGTIVVGLMLGIAGAGLLGLTVSSLGGGDGGRQRQKASTTGPPPLPGQGRPSHVPVPDAPDWLHNAMGPTPRDCTLSETLGLWLRVKLPFMFRDELTLWRAVMHRHGTTAWAVRIKANRRVYDPAAHESHFFGMVLLAPDLPASTTTLPLLIPIAEWIWQHRGGFSETWSREVRDFMRWVDNDLMSGFEERTIPSEISRGLRCVVTTTVFFKKDMPGGAMAITTIPVLYRREDQAATLVPPGCWPPSYRHQWLEELRVNARQEESGQDDSDAHVAFEVTNLPPDVLDVMEGWILEQCENRGIECRFLNTGYIRDPKGGSKPFSGELQFEGSFAQWDSILRCLNEAIAMHVPAELRQSVEIRTGGADGFSDPDIS